MCFADNFLPDCNLHIYFLNSFFFLTEQKFNFEDTDFVSFLCMFSVCALAYVCAHVRVPCLRKLPSPKTTLLKTLWF